MQKKKTVVVNFTDKVKVKQITCEAIEAMNNDFRCTCSHECAASLFWLVSEGKNPFRLTAAVASGV